MNKTYKPNEIEQRIYQQWENENYFAPSGVGESYCIMIPPPNVTGSLHMGHAFQDTIMDALIRYKRMCGCNALWQAGTDHAGIATQMVVERLLKQESVTRHDLGREEFVKRVWDWKQQSGGTITRQLRRMGSSLDWSHERFTMDDGLSQAVTEVFVQLFDEGLIYRGKRLVNWDPVLHTAISDLEVIAEEEKGHLWHMRYPLSDGSGSLVVATTRPETMLGDTAVAVHPEDERYQRFIGKTIRLPLCDRDIPVIGDDYVDREFGSGCVKITPAHDFNDYEIGKRHNLPMINVFTIDAKLNEAAPTRYQGMDRYDARKAIIQDLEAQNLLVKIDDHKLMVPRGDRSGTVIEPLLTDQWFVAIDTLAKPAIAAVENGDIRFVPDNWKNTYYDWMRNIQDWCISRQLWWGHRIPAWYDKDGNVYVGKDETEVRKKYGLDKKIVLKQDEDVLDTWFSSALWPFSTLGWPQQTQRLKDFYPGNVLVTGFDIIFFWVARMIMMGIKFTGEVPFHEVYIHGLVRDSHGQKMSKSKGNVLDPLDLIEGIDLETLVAKRNTGLMQPQMAPKIEKATRKEFPDGIPAFGADALRFTFAAMASTGRDINFDLQRVEGYRNFCNKIWNAANYVKMNCDNQDCGQTNKDKQLSIADNWIISRFQTTVDTVRQAFANYRMDLAAQAIYEFTWNEYCDWYLELSKAVLYDENAADTLVRGTRHTLVNVLESLLRLAHPIIPFITEEIWQDLRGLSSLEKIDSIKSIMLAPYPVANRNLISAQAENEMQWVQSFILGVRKIRGEYNISPGKPLPVLLQNGSDSDEALLHKHQSSLSKLCNTDSIVWLKANQVAPHSSTALVGEMRVLIPMAGLIDKQAEIDRLNKLLSKETKELERLASKLNNEEFISKAPEKVIAVERDKAKRSETSIEQLKQQLEKIKAM